MTPSICCRHSLTSSTMWSILWDLWNEHWVINTKCLDMKSQIAAVLCQAPSASNSDSRRKLFWMLEKRLVIVSWTLQTQAAPFILSTLQSVWFCKFCKLIWKVPQTVTESWDLEQAEKPARIAEHEIHYTEHFTTKDILVGVSELARVWLIPGKHRPIQWMITYALDNMHQE